MDDAHLAGWPSTEFVRREHGRIIVKQWYCTSLQGLGLFPSSDIWQPKLSGSSQMFVSVGEPDGIWLPHVSPKEHTFVMFMKRPVFLRHTCVFNFTLPWGYGVASGHISDKTYSPASMFALDGKACSDVLNIWILM